MFDARGGIVVRAMKKASASVTRESLQLVSNAGPVSGGAVPPVSVAPWQPLHDQLDHNYLNDVAGLENPTSEFLARWIWERLGPSLPGLARVTIFETCDARCEYEGD